MKIYNENNGIRNMYNTRFAFCVLIILFNNNFYKSNLQKYYEIYINYNST